MPPRRVNASRLKPTELRRDSNAYILMSTTHQSPRVRLEPNIAKIVEAISYIIVEAKRRNQTVTQYDIVKTLFLADKSHLNEYGRPITFDNYVAMKDGPVASVAYDFLKENKRTLEHYKLKKLPWKRSQRDTRSGRYYYSDAKANFDEDVLSPSDINALHDAFTTIKSLTFHQIRKLTHDDPAYIEAWNGDNQTKASKMSYGMLFDSPNFEYAETIKFLSEQK